MLESLPDGVAIADKEEKAIVYSNKAFEEVSQDLLRENDAKDKQILSTLKEVCLKEGVLKTKTTRRSISKVGIIFGSDNCFAYIVKNETETELKERKKIEEKYSKLLNLTFMHEIKTPVNSIIGIVSILKTDTNLPAPAQENIGLIDKTCTLLLYLLLDISDLLQSQYYALEAHYKDVQVHTIFDMVKDLFDFSFKAKGLDLKFKIHPNVPRRLSTDEQRYTQMLINLIGNALKYTTRGHVSVKAVYKEQEQKLFTTVKDTGIGINEETKNKIFRLYGKIEDPDCVVFPEGIGLGLTVTKLLCKLLNGDIEVRSLEGKGTTFTFWIKTEVSKLTIPLHYNTFNKIDDSENDIELEEYKTPIMKRRKIYKTKEELTNGSKSLFSRKEFKQRPQCKCPKILVVDDNEMNKYIIKQYSLKSNLLCDVASNGAEALELLLKRSKEKCCGIYSIVFLDINMPVLNGVQTMNEIKQHYQQGTLQKMIILAYTAIGNDYNLQEFSQIGFDDVALKPIPLTTFNEILKKYGIS